MGSSTNTTTTNSTSSLPDYVTNALATSVNKSIDNSNMANPVAGLVQQTGQWGNPAQIGAMNATTAAATYQPAQVGTGYQPYMVGTGYQAQSLTPGSVTQFGSPTVSGSDIQSMQNPYTAQVVQTSLDELNRQLAQTNQASNGQAAMAGAFGGDRAAIVNTENNRNANQIAAQTIASLNNQGFQTAASLAQQNASRQLQAGTAQGQLDANVGEANQYADLQAANLNATNDRSNQSATATAQALDATQQRANQTAGLTGANLNLTAAGQLNTIGNTYQATQNQDLANRYQAAYRDAMWPVTSTNQLVSNVGTLAGASPRTTSGTSTSPGTSTTGQVAGLTTSLLGINALTGNSLSNGVKSLFSSGSSSDNPNINSGTLPDSTINSLNNGEAAISDNGDVLPIPPIPPDAARGGLLGYAGGGSVDSEDQTYVPVDGSSYAGSGGRGDFSSWSRRAMTPTPPPPGPTPYDVGTQTDDRAPVTAGVGALVPTNPVLTVNDRNRANAQEGAAIWARESQFQKAEQDYYALLGDKDTPQQPQEAIRMATTRAVRDQGLNDTDAARFAAQLAQRVGLAQQQPQAQPQQAGLQPDDSSMTAAMAQPNYGAAPEPQAGIGPTIAANSPLRQPDPNAYESLQTTNPAEVIRAGAAHDGVNLPPPNNTAAQVGLAAPSRVDQSANPANPTPVSYSGPAPQGGLGGQSATDQLAHPRGVGDPNSPNYDWTQNKMGMSLLAAGLGMMASKSHTALGAIGDGGLAGVKQLQTMTKNQNDQDLKLATLASTDSYRRGVVSNGQDRNANTATRNEYYGDRVAGQNATDAAKLEIARSRADAYLQRTLTANNKPNNASILQGAINAYREANPDANEADALMAVRGITGRNQHYGNLDQAALTRIGQNERRINDNETFHAWAQQSNANAQEEAGVRTIVNAGAQVGKPVTWAQGLQQYRSSTSPATIQGSALPGSTQPGAQAQPSAPRRINNAADYAQVKPGESYIAPDGTTRTKPGTGY